MYVTNFYEYAKDITLFSVSPGTLGSTDQARIEILFNGVPLIQGIDYDAPVIPSGDVVIIRNITKSINKNDNLVIRVFDNSSHTNLEDSITVSVHSRFAYVEITGDVTNNISNTETVDKSLVMNTPITIAECDSVEVNGHYNHIFQIGTALDNTASPILVNGNVLVDSDIEFINNPSVPSISVNGSGIITTVGSFVEFASTNRSSLPLSIETTVTDVTTGIDAFVIDGVGFTHIQSNGFTQFEVLSPLGNYFSNKPSNTATYKVEVTTTEYNLYVNGVLEHTIPITTSYVSNRGTLTGSTGLGSPAQFNPTSVGTGYIGINFSGLFTAQQKINLVDTIPVITGGNSSINCGSTDITGTIAKYTSGLVSLYDINDVLISTGTISTLGEWEITGLNFQNLQNETFKLIGTSGTETSCNILNFTIQDVNCCVGVSAGSLSGSLLVAKNTNQTYSIIDIAGTAPYTYSWSLLPGTGTIIGSSTNSAVTLQITESTTLSLTISNCNGNSEATLTLNIDAFTGNAVNDVVMTYVNVPVLINFGLNDTFC